MATAQAVLDGGEVLDAKLRKLPVKVQKKFLRRSVGKGTRVIAKEIRRRARRVSKRLARAITSQVSMKAGRVTGTVGGRKKKPGTRLLHLFEFGTDPRRQEGGRRTGRMKPRPVMRPGFDASHRRASRALQDDLWSQIAKEARRKTA